MCQTRARGTSRRRNRRYPAVAFASRSASGPLGGLSRTRWVAPAERAARVKDFAGELVVAPSPSAFRAGGCRELMARATIAWAASFSCLFGISPGCWSPKDVPWMRATVITRTRLASGSWLRARRTASSIAASVNGWPAEASRTPAGCRAARAGAGRQKALIELSPFFPRQLLAGQRWSHRVRGGQAEAGIGALAPVVEGGVQGHDHQAQDEQERA